MPKLDALLASPLWGGLISAIITITVMKTDIAYIKEALANHDDRIIFLERNDYGISCK